MGLMDVLRRAEEQSKNAARRGKEMARATLNESGRTLRRQMRVNRPTAATQVSSGAEESDRASGSDSKLQARFSPVARNAVAQAAEPPRKKIISINGEDVRTEEVTPSTRRSA
jgi:hypothetical protein